ncbi:hypothetical protein, partial [uncultured Aquimarina sp.]|uniref:hypothetical protein n=1 Tax=uncultured Aquimarina sp. TaxID=575652 RepID=UPI00262C5E65
VSNQCADLSKNRVTFCSATTHILNVSHNSEKKMDFKKKYPHSKFADQFRAKTFEDVYEDLQDSNHYCDLIKHLRGGIKTEKGTSSQLHNFSEWVLGSRITEFLDSNTFKIEPEKYGISNGRIDLALYHQSRSVIHFEIIASNSGGHVFRDTTSLLVSEADTKLAILIDPDIDEEIAKHYLKAIAKGQIPHIHLRTLILESEKPKLKNEIERLISQAEFYNGATNPNKFYCQPNTLSAGCYDTISVDLYNAPDKERAVCYIRTKDDLIDIGGGNIQNSPQRFHLTIPYRDSIAFKGLHRIEIKLNNGEKWASNFHINTNTPKPAVRLVKNKLAIGETSKFVADNFPPNVEMSFTLWQNGSGVGCNSSKLTTDDRGHCEGEFTIPHLIGSSFAKPGKHRFDARIKYNYLAKAEGFLDIEELEGTEEMKVVGTTTGSSNGVVSFQLQGITLMKNKISLVLEIMKVNEDFPVILESASARIGNVFLQQDGMPFFREELKFLEPFKCEITYGSQEQLIELNDNNALLKLQASFNVQGHPFSLEVNRRMLAEEVNFINEGKSG